MTTMTEDQAQQALDIVFNCDIEARKLTQAIEYLRECAHNVCYEVPDSSDEWAQNLDSMIQAVRARIANVNRLRSRLCRESMEQI